MSKWLLVDNYDSFTYNLVQLFNHAGIFDIDVIRNDEVNIEECQNYDCIVLSPGPNSPQKTPNNHQIIKTYLGKKPILGICLGMQVISEVFGGKTIKAPYPVHGKTSKVISKNTGLFKGLPEFIEVARYHSLCTSSFSNLLIDAITEDNIIMAVSNPKLNIYGLQFHPESFLTVNGNDLIRNFIKCAKL